MNKTNYGIYEELLNNQYVYVNVSDIQVDNIDNHINQVVNILLDYIDNPNVVGKYVLLNFGTDEIKLSIFDYMFNLMLWLSILSVGKKLEPKHISFDKYITRDTIKNYIDKFITSDNYVISTFDMRFLNNVIADVLYRIQKTHAFGTYLTNTITLDDDADLYSRNDLARMLYDTDLSNVPINMIKSEGTSRMLQLKEIIEKDGKHGLGAFFQSKEGVSEKQYREYAINIGIKPDGQGNIFPEPINSSYINGGLTNIKSLFIDDSTGRIAQYHQKKNVGYSGDFGRVLGLNNQDTLLHKDHNYVCDTRNTVPLVITSEKMLKNYIGRYYKLSERGIDNIITREDTHLIGRQIFIYSPMTCASHSRGEGICRRCYGNLYYVNRIVNVGKLASEYISEKFTQILLSAKHILEAIINMMKWIGPYNTFFRIESNTVVMRDDYENEMLDYKIVIDGDSIILENELDNFEYNEYITDFKIVTPDGTEMFIGTEDNEPLYITKEFNEIIRYRAKRIETDDDDDSKYMYVTIRDILEYESVEMDDDDDEDFFYSSDNLIKLFYLKIQNNELTKNLYELQHLIDLKAVTTSHNIPSILAEINRIAMEGVVKDLSAVHLEVILSNQIRDAHDILSKVDWTRTNPEYRINTLDSSLINNPSIFVSMNYKDLNAIFYNPLTFKKKGASFIDLFFMKNPKKFLEHDGDFEEKI